MLYDNVMIIYATKLAHLPVVDPESHLRLGVVTNCIFDPDLGKLSALEIASAGLFSHRLYVSFLDIVSIEQHAVLVNEDDVLPIVELPKVDEIIQSHRPIMNQNARTTTTKIGLVVEITFNVATGQITQIHTQKLFRRRIFAFSDIDKITRQAVFIRDDIAHLTITEALPETAPKIA